MSDIRRLMLDEGFLDDYGDLGDLDDRGDFVN